MTLSVVNRQNEITHTTVRVSPKSLISNVDGSEEETVQFSSERRYQMCESLH